MILHRIVFLLSLSDNSEKHRKATDIYIVKQEKHRKATDIYIVILYTVGGNVNWYSHYGKQYGGVSTNKK